MRNLPYQLVQDFFHQPGFLMLFCCLCFPGLGCKCSSNSWCRRTIFRGSRGDFLGTFFWTKKSYKTNHSSDLLFQPCFFFFFEKNTWKTKRVHNPNPLLTYINAYDLICTILSLDGFDWAGPQRICLATFDATNRSGLGEVVDVGDQPTLPRLV